ncbi:MAG: chitobiase/beta-hexosaminidase C-terminal domain-containing protein [Lachnospiraceae bacterium]|nr:chitobiase/beta-hexosaminidase C-terminal domain-containing protein [Lachnospiraceae bacterium]
MKKCSNCGAQLPDDELFCPRCGEEIHLVPVFETVESSINEQRKLLEEKERERIALMELEEEERNKALKKRNTILISVGAAAVIIVAFFGISFLLNTSKKSAFNSNYTKAVDAYNNGEYDSSLELITVALEKDPDNLAGTILLADIYAAQGKTDMAASVYREAIHNDPDSESAYRKLIGMYEALGDGASIRTLMNECTSESILEKFAEYITDVPVLSLEAGTYEDAQNLEITDENGNAVFYTLDGTDPTLLSLRYDSAIGLTGGTITVRAVAYNEKNVPSNIVEAVYVIEADSVDAPVVYPRATAFTLDDGKTHAFTVIVPRGTYALYSFDTMPTSESARYTGPVDMLEGNHTFYAVLVDRDSGVVSTPTSITYSLTASSAQESISVVQDADGNYSATYSDGSNYVAPTYDDNNGGGAVTPSDGGNTGGGDTPSVDPDPTPVETPEPVDTDPTPVDHDPTPVEPDSTVTEYCGTRGRWYRSTEKWNGTTVLSFY